MSFIGEAALSALFDIILQQIASSSQSLKFVSEKHVLSDITKWGKLFTQMKAVLEDAEEKQMTNNSVKIWLDDLKDLAYDVEDILDEFATESLQRQLKQKTGASTRKVRKVLRPVTTAINHVAAAKFNSTILSKMKEITIRFQDIAGRKSDLSLIEILGTSSSSKNVLQRPPTTCLQYEPQVYGRDEDKKKILKLLLKDETGEAKFGVIPIVGMGGVGKTTLAQLVYNDVQLVGRFDLRAWVCVSDEFDITRITKAILEAVTSPSGDPKELNQVQLKLSEALAGKKFLIVLDDVWNKKYGDWNVLRSPFMVGAPGSMVIVTTRSMEVGSMMGTVECQNLECVSDEDCWSIFARHAFENRSVEAHPNLEIIGRKIVKRCGGLPLAARTLGGLLRSKQRGNEWEDILKSTIWSLQNDDTDDIDILPVLRLSYYHLPSHLKRCFAYCAIFPKDYIFEEKELVLLWMAEGLIQQQHGSKQMEELGGEYFYDLLSRSFFQASSNHKSRFVMHDLINDLAQKVAGETCFRLEEESMVGKQFKKAKARHSSYIRGKYDRIERLEPFYKMKCVRTFLPLSLEKYDYEHPVNHIAKNVVYDLLPKLRRLRVLSFRHYRIAELPDSIGDLKHLRYLDLSHTKIETLPETTTSLCNLQTMLLTGCYYLEKLPSEMQKLINLRHLDIEDLNLREGMPLGIDKLKSVRTLPIFVVGKGSEAGITALMNLKYLQGALCISRLENVANTSDISGAILMDKEGIDDLALRWESNNTPEESIDRGVLDKMKPHVNLKKLTITNYGGSEFPPWVGDALFHNLMQLKLENCKKCTTLPHLGLLSSLKNLIIKGFSNVKTIDSEFYGGSMNNSNPFPALETLQFENMDEWKNWNICGFEFHNLRELSVVRCPNLLGKLPSDLRSLEKLNIEECLQLVVSFQNLPVISHLRIRGCKEVELSRGCNSPNYMEVSKVSFLFPPEEFMQGLRKVKRLSVGFDKNLWYALTWHFQERLPDIVVENEELLQKGISESEIEVLEIGNNCETLEKLFIRDSQRLISDFPFTLRTIEFHRCNAMIYRTLFVKEFEIYRCQSLISIGRDQLPPTLISLKIFNCEKLQSLLNDGEASSSSRDKNSDLLNLESLNIYGCESLASLGELPASLKCLVITRSKLESIAEILDNNISLEYIYIRNLPNLKYLPKNMSKLTNLHEIQIYDSPKLVSFPQGGLPTAHLKKLRVANCEKLDALPDNIQSLTSLQQLDMRCPGIMSFPEEGFPTNLTSLTLEKVKFCKPLFEWGLHRLTSLKNLSIIGGCSEVVSFPQDEIEMKLPTSLIRLDIESFPNLKYLSSKGFESLTSLEFLKIIRCPNLVSFPKNGLPPSLLKLRIICCPNLASFPKNGLPPSLLLLEITCCPLLERRCQKGKARELLEIACIPLVKIDPKEKEYGLEKKNERIKASTEVQVPPES